jgi:hypothetical protein
MSSIRVDKDNFLDFIALFLFGSVSGMIDLSDDNPEYNELMDELDKKGVIPPLHRYYISKGAEIRQKYNTFYRSFEKNQAENIYIGKGEKYNE